MTILFHARSSPGERESGEDLQNLAAELPLVLLVLVGHVQRVAEHVLYLVTVHDTHPLAPQVAAGSL